MSKSETITLRVDGMAKKSLEKMAGARGMSLSEFILTMLSEGASAEKAKRARLRQNVKDFVNKI